MRHIRVLVLAVTSLLLASTAVAGADPPGGEPPGGDAGGDQLSILGDTRMSADDLVATYEASGHRARLTVPLEELAGIFVEEGQALGVRADLAWAQSLVETGWFSYPDYGQVRWTDNNFAGIGAYDGGHHGFGYPDARSGVRAQMQLLRQYADPAPIDGALVHAPASKRGAVQSWWEMGNGNWATSPRYAGTVISLYTRLIEGAELTLERPVPAVVREGDGVWVASADGQVHDAGDARFWGSAASRGLGEAISAIATTASAEGYWVFTPSGRVLAFGDARPLGEPAGSAAVPVVAAASSPTGDGYWTVSDRGLVLPFGDAAPVAPAAGALGADDRVVGIAPTPTGDGYWLATASGRVVPVGDAPALGDLTGDPPDAPVMGIAARPAGDGYWLVTATGEVHRFGEAGDLGSLRDEVGPDAPAHLVVSVLATQTGDGYWLVCADGLVAGRGDAYDPGAAPVAGGPLVAAATRRGPAPEKRWAPEVASADGDLRAG